MANRYLISSSRELVRINPDRLVCVVADRNWSTIYHVDDLVDINYRRSEDFQSCPGRGRAVLVQIGRFENSIRSFKKEDQHFIRIGNSLIVNIDYIAAVLPVEMQIELSDNATFHVAFKASEKALKAIKEYLEKKEHRINGEEKA